MKILTYHDTLPGEQYRGDTELNALWTLRWAALGFTPITLDWTHIESVRWREMAEQFGKLPTVNNRMYEQACWMRWCAYSDWADENMGACESVLVADYDVFNTGIPPDRFRRFEPRLTAYDSSAMIGCVRLNLEMLNAMPHMLLAFAPRSLTKVNGRDHVSDMIAFHAMHRAGLVATDYLGVEYADRRPGGFLIHIANSVAGPLNRSKNELWAELDKEYPC